MKSLAFLEHVDHSRKAAIYAAEHDGKLRHFAYYEGLGECRETFAQLLQNVQKGEKEKLKVSKPRGSLFPIAKQEAMAEGEVTNIWHSTIP